MGNRIITNMVQAIVGIIIYALMLFVLKEETVMNVYNKYVLKKDETN